jgi:D-alanine transaminase
MRTVFLNGEFMPETEARIPVLDRGFIFGDGVYEVIPVYGDNLFRFEEHLQRLQNSLDALKIVNPLTTEEWKQTLTELVNRNNGGDLSLYLQVTRGSAERDHAIPENPTPTVFAMCNPLKPLPNETVVNGVSAITLDDIRWLRCHIKAISLLPNVLLRQEALDQGAAEAILIRDGLATEGAASNLFAVIEGIITTPPKSPMLLPGITRDLVLELAKDNGLPCQEKDISLEDLKQAEEIWLTSSTREILSVTQLDGKPVASGKPGPLYQQMLALYQNYKQALRQS